MKNLINKVKEGYFYFLHYPEQTLIIVQIYVLNPFYSFIEKVVRVCFELIRKFILILILMF